MTDCLHFGSVEVRVRTIRPFAGWLYVRDRFEEGVCVGRGDDSREAVLTVLDNTCGVKATPFVCLPRHPSLIGAQRRRGPLRGSIC